MKTSTMVYAALFCAAMIASYLTWTKEPEPIDDDGSIVLIDAKPDDVAKIIYTSKDLDATFEHKKDDLGSYVWVSATRQVEKKKQLPNPHDPHAGLDMKKGQTNGGTTGPAEVAEPPEEKPKITEKKLAFKAGKAGDQLLEDLAPFKVSRKLDVGADDLKKFGFDEPSGTLTVVTTSGTERKFEIGDTAYGHKHVYLRDPATKEVFVMKRSIVSPLERADTRLPEKELFDGAVSTIEKVSIATASDSLNLVQRNRDDEAKASWTAPDSDTANASADSWLDKVFRLRASDYVDPATKPQTELVFAVKLDFEDAKPVKIEVFRGVDDKGEEAWYARSEYTRGLVTLNSGMASDAAADVATLFAGE